MRNNPKPKVHKQSKYFTIMLVPHSSGRTRSLRIPLVAFYMTMGLIAICAVCFASFVAATEYFRKEAQSAYWDLEQSSEINNILEKEKLELNQLLSDEQKDSMKSIERQREIYEEIIKTYDSYYEDKVNELEEKLDNLDKARDEIDNLLSKKTYLPEINLVADSGIGTKPVFMSTLHDEREPGVRERIDNLDAQVNERMVYFDNLMGELERIKPYIDNYPTRWPVHGTITSEHSYRANPFSGRGSEYHSGLDIAVSTGTNVRATGGGRVIYAGWYSSYGYMVNISHGFGIVTRYAHNSAVKVEVGDYVSRGDVIALSGSTGRSTGPHVHYEVIVNGESVNPRKYIE